MKKKPKKVTTKPKRKSQPNPKAATKLKATPSGNGLMTWPPDEPMESVEYLAALKKLGLTTASQRTAKALGVSNVRQCQRFLTGDAVIPASVSRLLAMYLKHGLPADVRD